MQSIIKVNRKEYKLLSQHYPGVDGLYVAVYHNNRCIDQLCFKAKAGGDEIIFHNEVRKDKEFKKYLKSLK